MDGTDFLASYRAHARGRRITAARDTGRRWCTRTCVRPYSHSLSDDERLYKTAAEREAEAERDPVLNFPELLVDEGVLDRQALQRIVHEIDEEVQEATEQALRAAAARARFGPGASVFRPRRSHFGRIRTPTPQFAGEPQDHGGPDQRHACAKRCAATRDIVVFGEDVADCSREENLAEVKGKGGVFKVTARPADRVRRAAACSTRRSPKPAIVGRAIGMATRGLKPVVEIQFFDYIWPAMMQIRDELATLRWRSNGGFSCPVVLRVPIGGYLNGGAIYHSQCGEVEFTHIPGLRVVMPSNALDACGLLRTAIRSDDPVLFLEHKQLYREPYNRSPHPGADFMIPFGSAKVVKTGTEPDHRHLRRAGAESRCRRRCRWSAGIRTRASK